MPWTPDEAVTFLQAAADDPLYPAFVLLMLYGMRRGEVLGLRWCDIYTEAELIRVRQQLQRVQGQLILGPVKTRAGNRDLPLIGLAKDALSARRQAQDTDRANLGRCWANTGLVFTTRTGRPVEPRNLVRSFTRICENHGLRRVPIHKIRTMVATLLKKLNVPARDAQAILGHAHISTTQQIYTYVDEASRLDAVTRLNELLSGAK